MKVVRVTITVGNKEVLIRMLNDAWLGLSSLTIDSFRGHCWKEGRVPTPLPPSVALSLEPYKGT